jgi:hypothetical protein
VNPILISRLQIREGTLSRGDVTEVDWRILSQSSSRTPHENPAFRQGGCRGGVLDLELLDARSDDNNHLQP